VQDLTRLVTLALEMGKKAWDFLRHQWSEFMEGRGTSAGHHEGWAQGERETGAEGKPEPGYDKDWRKDSWASDGDDDDEVPPD
jgi:hypothetical protein